MSFVRCALHIDADSNAPNKSKSPPEDEQKRSRAMET